MKHSFFTSVAACVLLLSSCTSNEDILTPKEQSVSVVNKQQFSLNQAKTFSGLFSQIVMPEDTLVKTRSTQNVSDAKEIEDIKFYISTSGDTLMYCINYKNNGGYIVLSGNNTGFPLLACADEGYFSFDVSADNPVITWIETQAEKIANEFATGGGSDSELDDAWKNLGEEGYSYEVEVVNEVPEPTPTGEIQLRRSKTSSGKATIYPFTGSQLKWHQSSPYNYNAPNRKLVGCPALSTAMLVYNIANWHYSYLPSYFDKYPIYYIGTNYTTNQETLLSKMLRDIADHIPNYIFGYGSPHDIGSGCYTHNLTTGLISMGFSNAQCKTYEIEEAYRNIQKTGIILFGHNGYSSGHFWFCDGYFEQKYKVTRKFIGIKIKTWYEYEDQLYMNWGWNDGRNGWFADFGDFNKNKLMYVNLTK